MKKQFKAEWGSWEDLAIHSYEDKSETVDTAFFNDQNGYEEEDIEQINELEIGQQWNDGYGNHRVTRII